MTVTIRALLAAHPALFYPQAWYTHEPFVYAALVMPVPPPLGRIDALIGDGHIVWRGQQALVPAVALVDAYVKAPTLAIWHDYLWTDDTDQHGQRIYVGGTANGHGFEIHRHLHLTKRWGVPVW